MFKFVNLASIPLEVSTSLDGTNWTLIATVDCTSKFTWQLKTVAIDDNYARYVRIIKDLETTGANILGLDDIQVSSYNPVIHSATSPANSNQIWLVFTSGATYDIQPEPWYSTNLMNSNGWHKATGASYTYNNGVYTQKFDKVTNSTIHFYKITSN